MPCAAEDVVGADGPNDFNRLDGGILGLIDRDDVIVMGDGDPRHVISAEVQVHPLQPLFGPLLYRADPTDGDAGGSGNGAARLDSELG